MQDLKNALGPGGWVALVAVLVGFIVRLIKADKLNDALAKWGIPAIPKAALPWASLALGFAAMTLDAKVGGATWGAALAAGLTGILSGALAIAGNETVAEVGAKVSPKLLGRVVFGKGEPTAANANGSNNTGAPPAPAA